MDKINFEELVWENLFTKKIIDRGFDYYLEDKILSFKIDGNIINATVSGYHDYQVSIKIDNNKIIEMNCDCPYAIDGNNCKHMVALLYYCEDIDIEEVIFDNGKEDIFKIVSNADIEKTQVFLTEIFKNDDVLFSRFKKLIGYKTTNDDLKRYKKIIDNIFNMYSDKYGYINYYNGRGFCKDLATFFSDDIQTLLDNGEYYQAFELINYIFIKISNQHIDGSNGEVGEIMFYCNEAWKEILLDCSYDFKNEMFDWFINHLDGLIVDYMEEQLEDIVFNEFEEEAFLDKKIKFIRSKLDQCDINNDDWTKKYVSQKWASHYVNILEQKNASWENIENFCNQYWKVSSIREFYVKKMLEQKQYDLAIKVLEKSKLIDNEYAGLVKKYSYQLKELYQKIGDQKAYKNEVWLLLTKYDIANIEIYKEYKGLFFDSDWINEREMLFNKLPKTTDLSKFYELEKLYDRLLDLVVNSNGIYLVDRYCEVLQEKYSKEILEKYRVEIEKMAKPTNGRNQYKNLMKILNKMKHLIGGEELVEAIIDNWKVIYKKRKAMMEELGRL